jgi:glycerophosphoryl diester phosphodiesterase
VDTPRRPGLSVITTQHPVPGRGPGTRRRETMSSGWTVGARPRRRPGRPSSDLAPLGYPGRPLVLGHRGSTSGGCRENSVRSVLEAMSKGADGVEVDVRLTLDGVLVCSHDDRVTTPLGRPLLVSRTTASELLACAGTGSQDRLATLAEVLTILEAAAGHVVVEAKPADDHVGAFRTARALAGLLLPLSTSTSITVSSFDPRVLDAVRRLVFGTSVRTALLADGSQSAVAALRQVDEAGYDEAHLSVEALRQAPHAVRMAAPGSRCSPRGRRPHHRRHPRRPGSPAPGYSAVRPGPGC